jgi:hypothetical protein
MKPYQMQSTSNHEFGNQPKPTDPRHVKLPCQRIKVADFWVENELKRNNTDSGESCV